MKTTTLKAIREDMSKFLPVVKLLKDFNANSFPVVGILYVMISNICQDFTNSVGYSPEEEEKKIMQSLDIFREIGQYETDFYVAKYICREADMIIVGQIMLENEM